MRAKAPLAAFLLLVCAALLGYFSFPAGPQPAFVVNTLPAAKTGKATPWFQSDFLPAAGPSVHAVTLTRLSGNRLGAAWFVGSREGAGDVRIVFSNRPLPSPENRSGATWSLPRTIANRDQTQRDTRRSIRKLGNPVLYRDEAGQLHFFYVTSSLGGWGGSSINYRKSSDEGEHWTPAIKLVTSPFLNVSTMVRTAPMPMAGHAFGLPVYHEFVTKHGEWLHLTTDGQILGKYRMPLPRKSLQPTVVAFDAQHALALLRDSGAGDGYIQVSTTADGGQHWQAGSPLPLRNPHSSIVAIRLDDGQLLLATNPATGRNTLQLWTSDDAGQHWVQRHTVDAPGYPPVDTQAASPGSDSNWRAHSDETSYPALLQDDEGNVHLAYTWHRKRIRVMSFNKAWLYAQGGKH